MPDGSYFVDDFFLYSDTAGTTVVFSDNFDDNYDVGFDLSTGTDTPYAGDTFDAVVSLR